MSVQPTEVLRILMADPRFREAMAFLKQDEAARFAELKEMVLVHGAPFKEHLKRAPMYCEKLVAYGATDCAIDKEGNVTGTVSGQARDARPVVLVEGHMDTVFPEETPLAVTERDGFFFCPGIGDDTAALACNLSVLRAIRHAGLVPVGTLLFGGTVGEEGEGNARGIRYLMESRKDIDVSLSVESHAADYLNLSAVGTHRREYVFSGSGGHSWKDFGIPNPAHALGRAIAGIADIQTSQNPKTTFSVGIVNGGTSINTIAQEMRMKVDMRSVDDDALNRLVDEVQARVQKGVDDENARWNSDDARVSFRVLGSKPAGSLPETSVVAQTALAANDVLGLPRKQYPAASTNQNIPISLGVPAAVLGSGGIFRGIHTPEESYSPEGSYLGAQKILLMLFALAGLAGVTDPLASAVQRKKEYS